MIHFVGIGGIGMSALARLMLARGVAVSGSDVRRTPLIDRLETEGARITIGHASANVEDATRLVYSSAIDSENAEMKRARERGLEMISRGELLAELTRGKSTIAVAGTHGKTTTTAMIASVLEHAGLDPTVAIGGERVGSDGNARAGNGKWFVTESDESDGSFLRLDPTFAIVTNVENDHVGTDGEWEAMQETFERFVAKVPSDGRLILGADDPRSAALEGEAYDRTITYGIASPSATITAQIERFEGFGTESEIMHDGVTLGTLRLRVPGEINVQNALAAIAVARAMDLPFSTIAEALAGFQGVHRRFEILVRGARLTLVDDYAHHPTAVRATIAIARRYHDGPIVVAFEPHRYTRTKYLASEFTEALSDADSVILAPVYAASEEPIAGVSERTIGDPLAARGMAVAYAPSTEGIPDLIRRSAPSGALVLMLGAGGISRVAHAFAESLKAPVK